MCASLLELEDTPIVAVSNDTHHKIQSTDQQLGPFRLEDDESVAKNTFD